MATAEQLEAALRKADAAGNVDDARALAAALRQMRAAPQGWQPTKRSPEDIRALATPQDPTEGMSFPAQYAAGYGKTYNDVWQGVRQLGAAGVDAVAGTNLSEGVQAEVDRTRAIDAPLVDSAGGKAGRMGGGIVQIATPFTNAGKLVSYAGKGAPAVQGAVQGAAYGGIQSTATGESRGLNTAMGGALGAGGAAIAPAILAAGRGVAGIVSKEGKALYEAAKARGIELTPAQLSDSRFVKYLASTLQSLPGSGARKQAAAQKAQFNRAASRTIGEDADALTPPVYANAKQRQSMQFEELTNRNDLKVTPDLFPKLQGVLKDAKVAGGDAYFAVESAIDDLLERAVTAPGKGVHIPGAAYQAFDSALGQITKQGTPVSHFVGRVKGVVRDAMDRSISPADRKAWDALRKEYGNRKTMRDLVAKADDSGISPAAVMGRVTANNYGKEAMASGTRGELGVLAQIGQRMKEPPSSGTAERLLAGQTLNPLAWPIMGLRALAGATGGRAANSQGLAALLASPNAGSSLVGLSRAVDKTKPQYLLPAAGVALPAQAKPKDKKPKKR